MYPASPWVRPPERLLQSEPSLCNHFKPNAQAWVILGLLSLSWHTPLLECEEISEFVQKLREIYHIVQIKKKSVLAEQPIVHCVQTTLVGSATNDGTYPV